MTVTKRTCLESARVTKNVNASEQVLVLYATNVPYFPTWRLLFV